MAARKSARSSTSRFSPSHRWRWMVSNAARIRGAADRPARWRLDHAARQVGIPGDPRVLLSRGRGSGKDPGEFRRSQNWIGGSRRGNAAFVPPPHTAVPAAWQRWSRYCTPPTIAARSNAVSGYSALASSSTRLSNTWISRLMLSIVARPGRGLPAPLLESPPAPAGRSCAWSSWAAGHQQISPHLVRG